MAAWVVLAGGVASAALGAAAQAAPVALSTSAPTIVSVSPERIARGDTLTLTLSPAGAAGAVSSVRIDGKDVRCCEDVVGNKVTVRVDSTPDPRRALAKGEYERDVSVVIEGKELGRISFKQVTWEAVLAPHVWLWIVLYLVVLAAAASSKTGRGLLRSESGEWSLSKAQMALWTVLFSFCYILLVAVWKDFLDITEGMFWLMGISSTTAAGAKLIAASRPAPANPSRLLSDFNPKKNDYALSLHRAQIALWTAIVAVVFVYELYETLHFPAIPGNLLVLMGISGGTYLGYNFAPPAKGGD